MGKKYLALYWGNLFKDTCLKVTTSKGITGYSCANGTILCFLKLCLKIMFCLKQTFCQNNIQEKVNFLSETEWKIQKFLIYLSSYKLQFYPPRHNTTAVILFKSMSLYWYTSFIWSPWIMLWFTLGFAHSMSLHKYTLTGIHIILSYRVVSESWKYPML